jgi:FAD:protein FMN transferase
MAPILQTMGLLPASAGRSASAGPLATSAGIELCADGSVRFHHPDLTVDLGGIAKGFAVDRAVDVLREHGIGGLVNAGGDLAAFGPDAHIVHIRDPGNPDRFISRAALRNQALASSGGGFDLFRSASVGGPTVIDPATRAPASGIRGATVCARSCMIADALTKVVMVAAQGAGQLLEQYRASAMFVTADGDIRATSNWQEASDLAA